jgi:DNA-binding transcriptional MerR regulator
MPTEQEYSLTELATLAGVTPRTIRYYISLGLLPSPPQAGPATRYGDGHLSRVRLIRRLQAEHLPLSEIRGRMAGLDDSAVETALADSARADTPGATAGSALDYIRSLRGRPSPAAGLAASNRSNPRPAGAPPGSAGWTSPVDPGGTAEASAPADHGGPLRSQWERVALGPNVELHIRRPLSRLENKRVERLINIARELLEEDQP